MGFTRVKPHGTLLVQYMGFMLPDDKNDPDQQSAYEPAVLGMQRLMTPRLITLASHLDKKFG